ncbi:MAG: 4Fe-4S dicluster domain-containing protein [Phycisphaeraceae bacterium]|nr:4Fe-4S dicluster domain-containing protein [Phycisphaeraceae bacterium]
MTTARNGAGGCGDGGITAARSGRTLPLQVLPGGARPQGPAGGSQVRKSRMGKWRAIVLALVNVLMAAHIIQWLITGMTLGPVEPSEAMYTLERGELNPGFVFFVVALTATFVFGRFFCGWGCHVVALQDACTWFMNRLGVRPRPFRSRLLMWAPLLLALYMFVWPTFKREALFPLLRWAGVQSPYWLEEPPPFPGITPHFFVENFWATFPPWYVAIPFLAVCGFAAVYFLGSKGFCTYGCPYGGFFAPVDRVAIGRIVVTDACNGCGHCTAVCSSNVRVHQEVKDFGKIVDPGCMKCLDCVSICPNDALKFSFASPAVFTRGRTEAATSGATQRPPYDLTWWGDLVLFTVGLGLFVSFRGMFDMVPLLMAGGIAAIGAFGAWKLWHLILSPNVRLQSLLLKNKGSLRPAGVVFGVATLLMLAVAVWGGTVNYHRWQGDMLDTRVAVPYEVVFAPGYAPRPEDKALAERALAHLERSGAPAEGGIGWKHLPATKVRMAWLHAVAGDFEWAERRLTQAIDEGTPNGDMVFSLARIYMLSGRPPQEGKALYERVLEKNPRLDVVRVALAGMELQFGGGDIAARHAAMVLERADTALPGDLVRAAEIMIDAGRPRDALTAMERAVNARPNVALLRAGLAQAARFSGDLPRAVAELRRATELAEEQLVFHIRLIETLAEMGDIKGAQEAEARAVEIQRRIQQRMAPPR